MLNSWDEWTQLREVVVGSGENYASHQRELSFDLFFWDHVAPSTYYLPRVRPRERGAESKRHDIKDRYVEELNEDVEGIVKALEQSGVRVMRPLKLQSTTGNIATLVFEAAAVPALNIRDNTLVIGDEFIETSPMVRSRYFETQLLKKIYMHYFDMGARWTVMPRPLMTDNSFDTSYANRAGEPIGDAAIPSPYDVGYEIMFDGAQCLRLGADLIANISTANHAKAVDWMERHLDGKVRIHRVFELTDGHLDSMLLPLRPGLFLTRNEQVKEKLPDVFKSWECVVAPLADKVNFPQYEDDDLVLTSPFIDLNVLSINEETVMVNDACPDLIRLLERRGFGVIPVRHRHRRIFGGGFHCFTLDTVRDGGREDYRG